MTSPEVRRLAARIAALEAAGASRSPQLAYTALEDGAIREFDLEGSPVAQYGKQYDDTHTAASLTGPTPPTPTTPLVVGVPGGLEIGWDGLYANGLLTVAPMDWTRLDVVVGPVGIDPIATPPSAAIVSPRGGTVFVPAVPGDYDVLFVSRTQSGKASEPSLVVTATALESGGAGADAEARAAAQQAIEDAAAANLLAQQAQATADAATVVYRQSTAPTTGMAVNDLWIDSDDGLLYAYNGSTWVLSADQRVAAVVASNATKVTIFAQTSAPSTTGRTVGDLWIDTDDGNKIYDWSGSWTARTLGASAISATARQLGSTTVYRQSTAPAAGGLIVNDLWIDSDDNVLYAWSGSTWTLSADQRISDVVAATSVKVSAFTQASAPTSTGRVNGDIWIDTASGNKINVWNGSSWQPFVLGGTALAADAIDGKTITGALIRSAAGGARWELLTGPGSNKLLGYTDDSASAPGQIAISTSTGSISLLSPDYSAAGDGSGAAQLLVGGSKVNSYSTVDGIAGSVSFFGDEIINLTAGVSPNSSYIQLLEDGVGNRRISMSAAERFYADAVTYLTLAQLNPSRTTVQSSLELANGVVDILTGYLRANNGIRSDRMRSQEFKCSTVSVAAFQPGPGGASYGSFGGAGTFVAPPSGSVTIGFGALIKGRAANIYVSTGVRVRTGGTQDSGTIVYDYNTDDFAANYTASFVTVWNEIQLAGLTPGNTYNIRQMGGTADTTAGAQICRGRILVRMDP